MIEFKQFERCQRCGQVCRAGIGNPNSRPFRKASKGLCINCAMTQFLKVTEPISSLMSDIGTQSLLQYHIQEQIYRIMEAGNCDASPNEISWQIIVEQWDLPMPKFEK